MQAVFNANAFTLLVSSQNGSTNRMDLRTMQRQNIGPVRPESQPGGRTLPYRRRHRTKKDAVTAALREYIGHRRRLRLLEMFGGVEFDPSHSINRSAGSARAACA